MKIIDNKKDYYDYVSSIWGIDDKVVYDRRGSVILEGVDEIYANLDYPLNRIPNTWDRGQELKNKYELKMPSNIEIAKHLSYNAKVLEGRVSFFCLEVGFYHYIFAVERFIEKKDVGDDEIVMKQELVKKERVSKHISKVPLAILNIDFRRGFFNQSDEYRINEKRIIDNPILSGTWLKKDIDAEEIWQYLYEYISSLNDKEIIDARTNEQKIESYGFDKKSSFRNIK